MSKRRSRIILVAVLVILGLGSLAFAARAMQFSPQALGKAEIPTIIPTIMPAYSTLGWRDVARYLEAILAIDVLAMGERDSKAFAAICVNGDAAEAEFHYVGKLTLRALTVFGKGDSQDAAVSFFLEPAGEDPRYRLTYGIVCELVAGEVESCQGGPLNGLLEQESVLWPGRE